MAHYRFEVRTRSHVLAQERADLADMDAARIEAARRIADLLKEHAHILWAEEDWHMDVTDDAGLILFIIQVSAISAPSTGRGQAPEA